MIEGTDFIRCADGCGRFVTFQNIDIDGPERIQPSGFYCKTCDNYAANECGDREARTCDMCKAYHAAQDMASLAREIERAVERSHYKDAIRANAEMVGVLHDLGRRVRILDAKMRKGIDCEADCNECRMGAA